MNEKKKITAALSAVVHYIRTEEETAARSFLEGQAPAVPTGQNLWGLNGRQTQMQMRTMVSMKAFHGWKAG